MLLYQILGLFSVILHMMHPKSSFSVLRRSYYRNTRKIQKGLAQKIHWGKKGITKYDEQESAPPATVPRDQIQIQIQIHQSRGRGGKIHPQYLNQEPTGERKHAHGQGEEQEHKAESSYLVACEQRRRTCKNMFHGRFIAATD